ncbi:MAG: thiamine phosphate synthase [Bacteroidales bacterium]|jgi:thiamine-phosphate pyrophosphorylase|nr:thiamine phosphate synthase [Bacteroidales bacterium]
MINFQFITNKTDRYDHVESARIALEGGCKWLQLRMKEIPMETMEETALKVKELCIIHRAIFIMDDHVTLAKKIRADGVHLGKMDMPVKEARAILRDDFIIGGTANTFEDILQLIDDGVDYIGLGPFRLTDTKKNLGPILGLDGYRKIMQQCKEQEIAISVVAVGGITENDIESLMQTGVIGVALSSEILQAENPIEKTRRIVNLVNR